MSKATQQTRISALPLRGMGDRSRDMRRDAGIQGQKKKNEVGEGEEACACVRTHLSITQSRDSLLTSPTRGSFQNHRLGPAGNWWSALCHGKRISTRSNTRDALLVPLNTSAAYLGGLQWLAKAFGSLTPKPKLICSPPTLQLEETVSWSVCLSGSWSHSLFQAFPSCQRHILTAPQTHYKLKRNLAQNRAEAFSELLRTCSHK